MRVVDSEKKSVSVSLTDRLLLDITLKNREGVPQPRPRPGKNGGYYSTPVNSKIDVFKSEIIVRARSYRGRLPTYEGPVELRLVFVFSGNEKAKEWAWETRQLKGDFDNLEKSVADAIKGIVIKNDSQVARNSTEKIHGPKGVKPFVRIQVFELMEPPGIPTQ